MPGYKSERLGEGMSDMTETGKSEKNGFSKKDILSSIRFSNRKDLLGAILENGRKYSISEVEKNLEHYYTRKVI